MINPFKMCYDGYDNLFGKERKCYHRGHGHHDHRQQVGTEKEEVQVVNQAKRKRTLVICIILVSAFMLIELIGGIISNSLALIADSMHMLTDLVSLILAFVGMTVSQKIKNGFKTYGYSRFEIIMSLINSVFLICVCIYIVIEAFMRFKNPQVINISVLLFVAISGLLINFLTMYLFYRNDQAEQNKGNKKNLLMHSAFLHFLSDAFGSFVAITSGVVLYFTNWNLIDPLLSILLVALIVKSSWGVIKDSVNILMEGAPKEFDSLTVKDSLEKNIVEIVDVHHIHLWMLNEQENIITLHSSIKQGSDHSLVVRKIQDYLLTKYGISHATIQLELEGTECVDCRL